MLGLLLTRGCELGQAVAKFKVPAAGRGQVQGPGQVVARFKVPAAGLSPVAPTPPGVKTRRAGFTGPRVGLNSFLVIDQ